MKKDIVYINAHGEIHGNCKGVKRDDGAEYGSYRETVLANNISNSSLRKAIENGTELKGHRYALADDKDQYIAIMERTIAKVNAKAAADAEIKAKAEAWDRYVAEQEAKRIAEEKRLAAIAKAEEERKKAIERAKAKVNRLSEEVKRKYILYSESLNKLNNAELELEALMETENEMEDAA